MIRTIERHIKELETLQKQMRDGYKKEPGPKKRAAIDKELRATVAAISHYQLALEIEGLPTFGRAEP